MPNVRYPKAFQALTKWLKLFELEWLRLVPIACLGSSFSFYDELLVMTIGPFLLALLIVAVGVFKWWRAAGKRKEEVKDMTIEALFLLTYVVLTGVSSTVFSFFHCVDHVRRYEDGSEDLWRVLQADYSISCDSSEYNGFWMAYACLMALERCGILPSARVEEVKPTS